MSIRERIARFFGRTDEESLNTQDTKTSDPEKELKNKADSIHSKAEIMNAAFNAYGINKPFILDASIPLVAGYDIWWRTVDHYDTGDEKREEVVPIYKFTSKDTIEVVGGMINEYDRITEPGTGLRISSPRRKVREVGLDEYKKMILEHQQVMQNVKSKTLRKM